MFSLLVSLRTAERCIQLPFNLNSKLTSHSILHCLWSVGLSKSFSQLCRDLSFLNIFFNRFYPVEKFGVPQCSLYRGSLTLSISKNGRKVIPEAAATLFLFCMGSIWNT